MTPVKLLMKFDANYNASYDDFVGYWKRIYSYPNPHLYHDNINLTEFTPQNLYDLFCWKNGMNLSTPKQLSFKKIEQKLDVVNQLKVRYDEDLFMEHFCGVSTIWQIFLRHTIQPADFPIFDQHVYRAFRYMQRQEKAELINDNDLKLRIYFEQYLPFYWDMEENTEQYSGKEIDDALWAFGRFLGTYPNMFL